jgi:hypothetical protein
MIKFKAWNARPLIDILSSRHWHFLVLRSRAIAKFHNAEIDYFGHNAIIHELIRGSLLNIKENQGQHSSSGNPGSGSNRGQVTLNFGVLIGYIYIRVIRFHWFIGVSG